MVELSDFIVETMNQIIAAIEKGSTDARMKSAGGEIAPKIDWHNVSIDKAQRSGIIGWKPWSITTGYEHIQPLIAVDFDVAVTISKESDANAKIGFFTGVFGAGGEAGSKDSDAQISRVKFTLPLALPNK